MGQKHPITTPNIGDVEQSRDIANSRHHTTFNPHSNVETSQTPITAQHSIRTPMQGHRARCPIAAGDMSAPLTTPHEHPVIGIGTLALSHPGHPVAVGGVHVRPGAESSERATSRGIHNAQEGSPEGDFTRFKAPLQGASSLSTLTPGRCHLTATSPRG